MGYAKIFSVESFMGDPEKMDLQIEIRIKDASWKQFQNIMDLYRGNKEVSLVDWGNMSGSVALNFNASIDKDKQEVSWQDEYYLDDRDLT